MLGHLVTQYRASPVLKIAQIFLVFSQKLNTAFWHSFRLAFDGLPEPRHIKSEKLEQLAVNLVHVCRNETKRRYFPAGQRKAELGNNNEIIARMQKIADGEL